MTINIPNDYLSARLDEHAQESDRKYAAYQVSITSDNPTVLSAFDSLMVAAIMAHPDEYKLAVRQKTLEWLFPADNPTIRNKPTLYAMIDAAIDSGEADVLIALDNFIDLSNRRRRRGCI